MPNDYMLHTVNSNVFVGIDISIFETKTIVPILGIKIHGLSSGHVNFVGT